MHKILLVEDSLILTKILTRKLNASEKFEVVHADSFSSAQEILEKGEHQFFLALLDLVLPDAKEGEIVDLVTACGVPAIIFSSIYSDDLREYMESKEGVIDYVVKTNHNVNFVTDLIDRIHKNRLFPILIVDDSRVSLAMTRRMLALYQFPVLQASDGAEAMRILAGNTNIRMVITDYRMPELDGLELLNWIRNDYGRSRNQLAVLGVSAHRSNALTARFIKSGGNDFLSKPFMREEFICRVMQNVDALSHLETIRELAQKDYLTGLYNRRYLFDAGGKLYNNARRKNFSLVVAVMDIDFFKSVNDKYGHYAGDLVLKSIARILKQSFRDTDVVARMGGEEFCILAANVKGEDIQTTFERFRKKVEALEVGFGDKVIKITLSIGVATKLDEDLEAMVHQADRLLYKAKESGRNRVVID
ncbi:MAG: diguanylate cyclase [Magnetococcales bacterium]|nr:diguanylate cyclase [Magnetococcales bacterium]